MGNTLTVGLLWHSVNSGNLGVGALTIANLRIVREAALKAGVSVRFLILGFVDPGRVPYVQGADVEIVRLDTRAMLPGGKFGAALARCDCVIDIGGGDSFTDIYGPKRFAFLAASKIMALRRKVPLILAPQTIGPFSRQPQSWLAGRILMKATEIFARDPMSFDVALAMAPGAHVHQAIDVAFALPFDKPLPHSGPTRVGINVSGLLFNRGYDGKSSFGMDVDYREYTLRLIETLDAREDFQVVLVPHVNSDAVPIDDDGRVADALLERFPRIERAGPFADPVAAKTAIAGLDFLIGGRMHACIAAYSSGVPVLPIAYSRKFAGLFEGVLNYPHMIPVTGVDTDNALAKTLSAIDNRDALRADIAAGLDGAQDLLAVYRDHLETMFRRIGKS